MGWFITVFETAQLIKAATDVSMSTEAYNC